MAQPIYDLVIIGGGPAGLTAGIYGSRAGLKTLILEKLAGPGGQVITTDVIENYPGFPEPIGGYELVDKMQTQATQFGAEIRSAEVSGIDIDPEENLKVLSLGSESISAYAVIVAVGAEHKRLGVPGEDRFWGRGISCCATCDGMFYRDKHVVVVGGGDTAVKEALFLTRFASKITMIHRRDRLRATKILQDRILADDKIEFIWKSVVKEVIGDTTVQAVRLRSVDTGEERILECEGVFLFVGFKPSTGFLNGFVELDERGYVTTDNDMGTSVPGVFACGDARKKLFRQIITACGEGATAAFASEKYIDDVKGTVYEAIDDERYHVG